MFDTLIITSSILLLEKIYLLLKFKNKIIIYAVTFFFYTKFSFYEEIYIFLNSNHLNTYIYLHNKNFEEKIQLYSIHNDLENTTTKLSKLKYTFISTYVRRS